MTNHNHSRTGMAGHYTDADRARTADIERQFRTIHSEEVRRAESGGRLRTAVRKIGFQPNPN
ncbi:hypothetical protein [Microbacterium sp. YY-01]|uniref:hypothetical protein n=1 Tax=Microbacterium sp. YY-01 TaxID=3421634 RepID=UPI003D162E81